jgi:hypothetical protein
MNSLERVTATFEHKAVDKVPIHHLGFASSIASKVLRREAYVGGGIQQWREAKALWEGEEAHQEYLERSLRDALEVAVAFDHDILRPAYWRMPERPVERRDEYTFVYGDLRGNYSVRRFDPQTELYQIVQQHPPEKETTFEELEEELSREEKALEGYHPADADFSDTRKIIETCGGEYAVRINDGHLGLPYSQIWLEAVASRPDLVERYLDVQTETAVKRTEGLSKAGAKFIFGGGDFASNEGTFYSPEAFHDLMLPRLNKIVDACHRHGMYFLFASDGNLWPVAEDLFDNSGIDGYYEIDRRAGMDLGRLRKRYPDLVLIGNISSHTLHKGTKKEVVEETLSCLDEAKKSGGIIVGASNYMMLGTPEENLMAMVDTIRKYR